MSLLEFTSKGIYCPQADVYIDPWRPVNRALITHGHSDHARPGSNSYLCHHLSVNILKLRLGVDIAVQGVAYGEVLYINNVAISFHPAGHIIGSAQIRLEYKGEIWVVSGDYKMMNDGVSTPFEPVKCHHFITETTFGLPIYKFPEFKKVYDDINAWCNANSELGLNSIVLGYSLGKSQVILHHLDKSFEIGLHGAVANVNQALESTGFSFPGVRITQEIKKGDLKGAVIVAPVSALGSPWLRKFMPYKISVCSGWMQLRGARRRKGVDKGFVLSDHCDWWQLNEAVLATGAQHIYTTHGYQHTYGKWLREQYGLEVTELKTMFETNDENDQ